MCCWKPRICVIYALLSRFFCRDLRQFLEAKKQIPPIYPLLECMEEICAISWNIATSYMMMIVHDVFKVFVGLVHAQTWTESALISWKAIIIIITMFAFPITLSCFQSRSAVPNSLNRQPGLPSIIARPSWTLADEDNNSIPTDDANRTITGNVALQVLPPRGHTCN